MRVEKNKQSPKKLKIQPLALEEIRRRLEVCTLSAVALEAGVSTASVYRLAKGEGDPSWRTVERVSAVLRALGGDEAFGGEHG